MAGLGEACTHIAAVLFYLEALARIQGTETSTQQACQWIIPSYMKSIEYRPIKKIDFTSARGKKRKLDELIDGEDSPQMESDVLLVVHREVATGSEMATLFQNLSLGGTCPAVFSVVSGYSEPFIPKFMLPNFPRPLMSLRQPEYVDLGYDELLALSETTVIEMTVEMPLAVEEETRLQSQSRLWFTFRAGRVTASRMKSVCHTNPANPSQSLIKTICYPEEFSFDSKQTAWGSKQERIAQEIYLRAQKHHHVNLHITNSGLVINPKWPYMGASPDAILDCSCCGKGILEIKCPYSHRYETIQDAVQDKGFCLKERDGLIKLDCTHAYFYQVQTQMFICDVDYSSFCVCTFAEDEMQGLHIERITRQQTFWEENKRKAEYFFRSCLLPEILGNWFTRDNISTSGSIDSELPSSGEPSSNNYISIEEQTFCYCHGPEEGLMIACDNPDCLIEWFHVRCLDLSCVPKGKWYCSDCSKLQQLLET